MAQDSFHPYSNPALIYGTSFGNYLSQLYRQGSYSDMLLFTHSESITTFGKEKILSFYKEMIWGYDMKLNSISRQNDTLILNYSAVINNTRKIGRLPVLIENDTCKLLLTELSFKNGIDGLSYFVNENTK